MKPQARKGSDHDRDRPTGPRTVKRFEGGTDVTRAMVVFESMFGNTQQIAEAVKEGLSSLMPTDIFEVGVVPHLLADDVDLLVVGGPTHAFGMSRPKTREDATRQAGGHVVSSGAGLREWLTTLGRADGNRAAAAFDTRIDKPRVPGSAARGAEKRLRKRGFRITSPSESFYVAGTAGPLVDGETDRARRWGEELGRGYLGGLEGTEVAVAPSEDITSGR